MLEIREKLSCEGYEELEEKTKAAELHITEAFDKETVIGFVAYSYEADKTVIYDYDDGGELMLCDGLIRSVLFKSCLKGIGSVELACGGEKLESLERLRFITKGSRVIDDPDSFMNGCEHCKNADKNREDQTF